MAHHVHHHGGMDAGAEINSAVQGGGEIMYYDGPDARCCCACTCPCCPPRKFKISNLLLVIDKKTGCCSLEAKTIDATTVKQAHMYTNCHTFDRCRGNAHVVINTTEPKDPDIPMYVAKPQSFFRDFALGVLGDGININGEPLWKGNTNGGCCGTGCCTSCACKHDVAEVRESVIIHERSHCHCCAPTHSATALRAVKDIQMDSHCLIGEIKFIDSAGALLEYMHVPRGEIKQVYDLATNAHKQRLLRLRGAFSAAASAAPSQVVMTEKS